MVKKEKSNLRLLDITMVDLNWSGRLSYVEDVLFGRNKRVKRNNMASLVMIMFMIFTIGIVSGMLIYWILYSLL